MLTFIAIGQILAPIAVEFNKTHATNPLWPGHARFHLVWQVLSHALSSLLAIGLLWWISPCPPERFYIAALLLGAPLFSFLIAVVVRHIYQGTLHDANGVRPWPLSLGGNRTLYLEMNLVLVVGGILLLSVALYRFHRPSL